MAQCMHIMKTGCNGKISRVSEFQNHLLKVSSLHISICLIQKSQFAMTDPLFLNLDFQNNNITNYGGNIRGNCR